MMDHLICHEVRFSGCKAPVFAWDGKKVAVLKMTVLPFFFFLFFLLYTLFSVFTTSFRYHHTFKSSSIQNDQERWSFQGQIGSES